MSAVPTDAGRRLDTELTAARLAVNDWHACASNDELDRWRRAQVRLIDAATAVGQFKAQAQLAALRAVNGAPVLVVGDLMEISVELIRQWADAPNFTSPLVRVQEIRIGDDGTKLLVMGRVELEDD